MKNSRKILSLIIAVTLLFGSISLISFAKTSEEVDTHLQFNENGEFKILQFADIQEKAPLKNITEKLIKEAIKAEQPDLIVLTGDNINSTAGKKKSSAKRTIDSVMSIFEKYEIPVAMVFGNHDTEGDVSRQMQMEWYEKYDCFIGCAGEDFGNGTCGTYYIPLYSSTDKNEMIFNLWMIDSGAQNTENDLGGYAATSKVQIEWYKETCKKLETQNGKKVPSLMFQHIGVPEIFDTLVEVPEGTEGAIKHRGDYYVLPEGSVGKLGETPCPPYYNNGQFDAILECGDVLGLFFGHDHLNTYEVDYKGVKLCCAPCVGFSSYNGIDNGVRTITLYENDLENFDTKVVTYLDYFDDNASRLLFTIHSDTSTSKDRTLARIKYPFAVILNIFR
jgi:3',5'-cyclic AMP phosphodiesterase CpdA